LVAAHPTSEANATAAAQTANSRRTNTSSDFRRSNANASEARAISRIPALDAVSRTPIHVNTSWSVRRRPRRVACAIRWPRTRAKAARFGLMYTPAGRPTLSDEKYWGMNRSTISIGTTTRQADEAISAKSRVTVALPWNMKNDTLRKTTNDTRAPTSQM